MSIVKIKAAFEKHLALMPNNISSTAYENATFTPVAGTPYQILILAARPPENPTYGDSFYRERGTFRIRLMYPRNKGSGAALVQAERIKEWFHRSLTLIEQGIYVIVDRTPAISEGGIFDDRYSVVIDTSYYVNLIRP